MRQFRQGNCQQWDPAVIQKILAHLDDNATFAATTLLPDCRASPTVGLFD
jgi:hypothetical protein